MKKRFLNPSGVECLGIIRKQYIAPLELKRATHFYVFYKYYALLELSENNKLFA